MSNFSGEHWDMKAGGGSAFWNADGTLVDALEEEETGLLVVEKLAEGWAVVRSESAMNH